MTRRHSAAANKGESQRWNDQRTLMELEQALAILGDRVRPLAARGVAVGEAAGCRVAERVCAVCDWPSTDVSMMDGFAGRAADLQGGAALPVAFEVPAGGVPGPLPPGAVARIFTGAPLPEGADVVVAQEEAVWCGDRVRLPVRAAGDCVRARGEVASAGAVLMEPGERVTPARLGMLIALGPPEIYVIPRPRIAILTTGTELLGPTEAMRPGAIRDGNGPMLVALACESGFAARREEPVKDVREAVRDRVAELSREVDLLITSGGVSVGDYDYVPAALEELQAEVLFHGLAIKPGKPTLVAKVEGCWVVGLPGNPASAFVGWHVVAGPITRALGGEPGAFAPVRERVCLAGPMNNRGSRTLLAPVRLRGGRAGREAVVLPSRGSHDLVALAQAEGFVEIGPGASVAAGEAVACMNVSAFGGGG